MIPDAELTTKQFKFFEAATGRQFRVVAFIGGIRSGKTFTGARVAADFVAAGPGLGWIVSPTYPMSLVPEREFESTGILGGCKQHNRGERWYEFINGHRVEVKTADVPDHLRGPGLDWIWIDEGSFIEEASFDILLGRVLDRNGIIFITTTPNGRNWVFDRIFRISQEQNSRYFCIRARSDENPRLNATDIADLRRNYTKEFAKQELDAEFVSFEGLVYKIFDPSLHIVPPFVIPRHWKVFGGIDFGFNDPFVHLWVAYHDRRYYICAEHYEPARPLSYHAARIRANPNDKSVVVRYSDPSNPQDVLELNQYGVPSVPGKRSIQTGIQRIYKLLEAVRPDGKPALVVFSDCVKTIEEFCKYSYKRDVQSETPIDKFNHCMDALRYCISSIYEDEDPVSLVEDSWDPKLTRNERKVWELQLFPNKFGKPRMVKEMENLEQI